MDIKLDEKKVEISFEKENEEWGEKQGGKKGGGGVEDWSLSEWKTKERRAEVETVERNEWNANKKDPFGRKRVHGEERNSGSSFSPAPTRPCRFIHTNRCLIW